MDESRRRNDLHNERHRRALRWGLFASVVAHALILLLFNSRFAVPPSPFSAAGPRAGDARAAAGGGAELLAFSVALPAAEPEAIPRPPPPLTPDVDVEVQPVEEELQISSALPDLVGGGVTGSGLGQRVGPGLADGTGSGDGGTSDEGRFRVIPPTPRGLILPPSERPGKVRGKEVEVWVFVTDGGQVVSDSTRIFPSTGDRGFDKRLREQANEWLFDPARRGTEIVAEWFRYTIIL
jgi:hypothetical protein